MKFNTGDLVYFIHATYLIPEFCGAMLIIAYNFSTKDYSCLSQVNLRTYKFLSGELEFLENYK